MARGKVFMALDNGTSREVDADIFGEWAVHLGLSWVHSDRGSPKRANTITHKPSGLRASCSETVGISKREACRIARHLAKTIPTGLIADDAFGKRVYEQILIATYGDPLPAWVAESLARYLTTPTPSAK